MLDWNNTKTLSSAIARTGMSISEFATFSGISKAQLYRLVNGEFHPRFKTQRKIEEALTRLLDRKRAANRRAA